MATAIDTMTPSTYTGVGAMHQKTKYTFDQPDSYHNMKTATAAANANTRKHRRHQRTQSDEGGDPTDGSGSLTYSAASSINSAGESTDSSFADIMRVLDDPELGPLMKEKGMAHHSQLQQQAICNPQSKAKSSQASVASSLQYSTDGDSNFLHGTDLVSTITGQPSDSMANDGGSYNTETEAFDNKNIMFAPADPTDSITKRKKEKKSKGRDASAGGSRICPTGSAGARLGMESVRSLSSMNTSKQSGSAATVRHRNLSPPPPPLPRKKEMQAAVEDDVCYAEWWMSCFPDSFLPKR